MALRGYLAGEVVEDFVDGFVDRREALRRLGLLGLTMTGAAGLLAACGNDGGNAGTPGTTASTTAPTSPTAGNTGAPPGQPGVAVTFPGPAGELLGAGAVPSGAAKGAVLVIHENRGLTPHFYDLTGRLAREGYAALCVDLLSAEGGTAAITDPAGPSAALGAAGEERLLADLTAGIGELQRRVPDAKVGAVGFCFGGAMAWRLVQAGDARLAAAVPFYGPPPDPADFTRSKAAVLGMFAGEDTRVNESRPRAEAALKAANLVHEIRTFDGAEHGFFNDTGSRYHPQAAGAAWTAVLAWFGRHLA